MWPLSKTAIEIVFNTSSGALLVCGIVLVIGLVGERKTELQTTDRERTWYRHFELMVILGVAGELIADGGIFFSSRQLQTISDQEILAANQQITGLAPRYWLVAAGAENIVARLKPFAGQKVVILECKLYEEMEVASMAAALAYRLDESGWLNAAGGHILVPDPANAASAGRSYNDIIFVSPEPGRCTQGIFIEIDPRGATQQVRNAASALATALDNAHIGAADLGHLNWSLPSFLSSADGLIIVSIGRRGL